MERRNDAGNNMLIDKTRQRGLLKHDKENFNFDSGV